MLNSNEGAVLVANEGCLLNAHEGVLNANEGGGGAQRQRGGLLNAKEEGAQFFKVF